MALLEQTDTSSQLAYLTDDRRKAMLDALLATRDTTTPSIAALSGHQMLGDPDNYIKVNFKNEYNLSHFGDVIAINKEHQLIQVKRDDKTITMTVTDETLLDRLKVGDIITVVVNPRFIWSSIRDHPEGTQTPETD
jgi:hypothetical protein